MNFKKAIIFAPLLLVLAFSLQSCKEYTTTESGLQYKIVFDSAGTPTELGGLSYVNMIYTNEKDTFKSAEVNGGMPLGIRLPDSLVFKASLEEGLSLLSVGDSAIVIVSTDSLYKNIFKVPVPEGISEGSMTTFYLKVISNISKDSVQYLEKKQQEERMKAQIQGQMQYQSDTTTISEYCKKNKLKAKKTPDGVFYVIKKAAEGLTLQPGDTAQVMYSGRLLDGTPFDSNIGGEAFPVVVGYDQVIRGWHSGLMAIKKGEKATIYIPSALGYGDRGAGAAIPPNAILVFDLEILK